MLKASGAILTSRWSLRDVLDNGTRSGIKETQLTLAYRNMHSCCCCEMRSKR